VYPTLQFVKALLDRYFAAQRDLSALRQPTTNVANVPQSKSVSAPAGLPDGLDFTNTSHFGTEEQLSPIIDWFKRKQIACEVDPRAVDTAGFFDEAATEIGNNYALYGNLVDRIRFAQKKGFTFLTLELSKRSQKEAQAIHAFCQKLYGYSMLARYIYQKQDKVARLSLQKAPAIRAFFDGIWLEWYVFMTCLEHFSDAKRVFSCARSVSLMFGNEDQHEIDVFFLVDGTTPLCIECKAGDFQAQIDKFVTLRKRLGIPSTHFILCSPKLTEEKAAGLSSMYELVFATPGMLKPVLNRLSM
jgi:hypothetical protein